MRVTVAYEDENGVEVSVILDGVTGIIKEDDKLVATHESGARLVTNGALMVEVEED